MLLAIDIGNTSISFGVLESGIVKKVWRVETGLASQILRVQLRKTLTNIKKFSKDFEDAVICSVVPKASAIARPIIAQTLSLKPLMVGDDLKVPIKNCYRNPRQVGQDRLVCAYAAMRLYGFPAIIIDLGTAITLDVVSKKKEYLGGVIAPGLRLFTESLFEKTALLPKVKIQPPAELIGRDTKNSILSGIFYGYGMLCEGMIGLLAKKIKSKPVVIATGGYTRLIRRFIKHIDVVDVDLIWKGIYLIYLESCGPGTAMVQGGPSECYPCESAN